MNQTVKLLAVLSIVAGNFVLWWPRDSSISASVPPPRTAGIRRQVVNPQSLEWRRVGAWMGLAGALVFLVDAVWRTHEGPVGGVFGFAIMGLLSFGVVSLIYYSRWGSTRSRPKAQTFGPRFCGGCLQRSGDEPPPSTSTINGFLGSELVGDEDYCPQCNSRVKTLWAIFFFPLIPTGSYRVLPTGRGMYIGRRVPLSATQVCKVYLTVAIFIAAVTPWIMALRPH